MLSEFLQQNLNKQISHSVLAQIQQQLTSAEELVDRLSRLRETNKMEKIQMELQQINNYVRVKESLAKALLTVQKGVVSKLIHQFLQGNQIVVQIAMKEKNNIQVLIMNLVKQIFFVDAEVSRQDEEGRQLEKYKNVLSSVKDRMMSKTQIPRRDLQELSALNQSYLLYRGQFDQKVAVFNTQIEQIFQRMQLFEQKMRRQFKEMLGLGQLRSYNVTPTKNSIIQQDFTPWSKLDPLHSAYNYYENDNLGIKSNLETKFPTQEYID